MMLHMTKVRTRAGGANTPKRGARSAERTQGPMATEDTMLAAAPSFATEALAQVKIAVPVGVNMVASTVRTSSHSLSWGVSRTGSRSVSGNAYEHDW